MMGQEKEEFLRGLDEVVEDRLYVSNAPADIGRECRANLWCISIGGSLADQLTVDELADFLQTVKNNRREQLLAHPNQRPMLFYVWYDGQAGQLRFSLVSETDIGLPFGCKLQPVDAVTRILQLCLESPHLDGIPFEELREVPLDEPSEELEEFVLEIFSERLP